MQTKLTLRMDRRLIERAKAFAAARRLSLSRMVAAGFELLPHPDEEPPALSPWVLSLSGDSPAGRPASDEELRSEWLDHEQKKHA